MLVSRMAVPGRVCLRGAPAAGCAPGPSLRGSQLSVSGERHLCNHLCKFARLRPPCHEQIRETERLVHYMGKTVGATRAECKELLRSPTLSHVPVYNVISNVNLVVERGIPLSQLLRLPWLLEIKNEYLVKRLNVLTTMPSLFQTASESAGFASYCEPYIRKYGAFFDKEKCQIKNYRNRIYYLADELDVSVRDVAESVAVPKILFTMPLDKVSQILQLIKDYHIPSESILRDPWMFLNTLHFDPADSAKRPTMKTNKKEKDVKLEEKMLHLAKRLDIHVSLLRAHVSDAKFKRVYSKKGFAFTNLLLDYGFPLRQIFTDVTIMESSVELIRKRLDVLRKVNHKPVIMRILISNDVDFYDYCSKFVFAPTILDQFDHQMSDFYARELAKLAAKLNSNEPLESLE